MSLLARWQACTQQPLGGRLRIAERYREGLVLMWLPHRQSHVPWAVRTSSRMGPLALRNPQGGGGGSSPHSASALDIVDLPIRTTSTGLTVLAVGHHQNIGEDYRERTLFQYNETSRGNTTISLPASSSAFRMMSIDTGASNQVVTSTVSWTDAELFAGFAVAGRVSGNTQDIYCRGTKTSATASFNLRAPANRIEIGSQIGGVWPWHGGGINAVLCWDIPLPDDLVLRAHEAPWELIERTIWVPVTAGGGATKSIAQIVEADAAQPVTAHAELTLQISRATEADSAQAMSAGGSTAETIGQAAEIDAAKALTTATALAQTISQVAEQDSAQALTHTPAGATAQVSESDAAQAFGAGLALMQAIGRAAEGNSARALAAAQAITAGMVLEIDSAPPIGVQQARAIGGAVEQDAAQEISAAGATTLGRVVEGDQALPIGAAQHATVGTAAEISQARPIASGIAAVFGLVLEIDAAQEFAAEVGAAVLGQAGEVDLARLMTAGGGSSIDPSTITRFVRSSAQPRIARSAAILRMTKGHP